MKFPAMTITMLATTLLLVHTSPAVDRAAACKLIPIDAMFRINADDVALPTALTKPVAAAGGELVHIQIAVASGTVASGSTVSASVEGLGTVTVRAVGYVNLTLPLPAGNNIGPASKPGLFPDPLVPLQGTGADVVQLEDHGGEGRCLSLSRALSLSRSLSLARARFSLARASLALSSPSLPPALPPVSASLCVCVGVGEGAPQVFWLTIEVPRTAAPGSHAGKFSATGCGDVAFSVQVITLG